MLQTAYSAYSPAGPPGLIDPPDTPSTTTDATAYTFFPVGNGVLVATRRDPVIGAAPISASTSFQYDPWNRQTDSTDSNGQRTNMTVDNLDRILTVTEGYGSSQPLTTTYTYYALGDLLCTQLPAGNAVAYTYDAAGRVASIARQSGCGATAPLEQTLYTYDASGHRISEIKQRIVSGSTPVTDATTTFAYSTTCHLDSQTVGDPNNPSVQSTTKFAYDCNNNLISVWDPNHSAQTTPSTSYTFDPLNRIAQVSQPWGGAGGGTAVTAYAYDIENHLSSVTDSERNQTTCVTSDRDLQTRQISPVTGTTAYAHNGHWSVASADRRQRNRHEPPSRRRRSSNLYHLLG